MPAQRKRASARSITSRLANVVVRSKRTFRKISISALCQQQKSQVFLFDHLVGAGQQGCRHLQSQAFGGGLVDDQLKFRRRLDR
jgi:hypothetical protein